MASLLGVGLKVAESIIPPIDGDPAKQFWYRLCVSGATLLALALCGLLWATAYGHNPMASGGGFATKNDLKQLATSRSVTDLTLMIDQLAQEQKQQNEDALERDIRDVFLKYCTSHDGLREEYYKQYQSDLLAYQHRNNGSSYPQILCPN